ncbi:MAG: glycyl-radical enzyme activating protein [Calditrichia bacterium]
MKGIVFDIQRYAVQDGPGIRTTIFFKGCPLHCWWCHNPESIRLAPEKRPEGARVSYLNLHFKGNGDLIGREYEVEELMQEIEKDVIFFEQSGGGVTFSGGEPLMQPEFLLEVLKACGKKGIHRALDTSGYAPWNVLEPLVNEVDLFLYDLKIMDEADHLKFTGVSNRPILANLQKLADTETPIRIRIPLIPGFTDTEENLTRIGEFLSSLNHIRRIDLLPFNKIGISKYERLGMVNRIGEVEGHNQEELCRIRDKMGAFGFLVQIGGE